jgi:hypothetical protein
MTLPVRLQLSRRKGFNLQALSLARNGLAAVNVTRPHRFGNPFVIGEAVDLDMARKWGWLPLGNPDYITPDVHQAVRRFRSVLFCDEAIHNHVCAELRGKNLACWCKPGDPCHADVLLELANRPICEETSR